jgi:hypothetical protein
MGDVSTNCSPGHLDSPFGPPNNSGVENFPPPWAQPNRHGKTMSTSRQKDRGVWPVVGNDKRTSYWPRGPWHRLLAYEWRPIKYVRLDTLQAERINSFAKCQDTDPTTPRRLWRGSTQQIEFCRSLSMVMRSTQGMTTRSFADHS